MQAALKTLLFALAIVPMQVTKAFEDATKDLVSGARIVLLHSATNLEYYLALPDDTPGPWQRVITKACQTDDKSMRWQINTGRTTVSPAVDGQPWCLDAGNMDEIFRRVSVNGCDGTQPNQDWIYTDDQHLQVNGEDRCLDLKDGKVEDGGWLQMWKCSPGNRNQTWIPELADI